MMTFLQKYQRVLTIAIAVCVVSTFVFFGTSRAFLPTEGEAQNEVVYSLPGVKLTRQQMRWRAFFLSSEISDAQDRKAVWTALFNPGFVSELIFETGLGEKLIARDPQTLQWIQDHWQRESTWSGYRHPQLSYLSFQSLISQINPGFQHNLKRWQSSKPQDLVQSKIQLWLQTKRAPLHAIRSLIRYQENAAGAQPDPSLATRSMQPFGYQSLQDWFGPRFPYLCVQLISQGAQKARELGYEISDAQVQAMLDERVSQLWKSYQQQEPNLDLAQFRAQLMINLGAEPADLISLWRDLALFERLCCHEGGRFLADAVSSEQMAHFLSQKTQVDIYEMPQEYNLNNFQDLCQLQLYWQMACGQDLNDLEVPAQIRNVNEVIRVAPELIAKVATLNVRRLTLDELRNRIGIKQLLAWQASNPLWTQLLEQSSQLANLAKTLSSQASLGEKMQLLITLQPENREQLDKLTIQWLVENQSDSLREWLDDVEPSQQNYRIPVAALSGPLPGIVNAREMFEKLQRQTLLSPYTQDGQHIYSIELKSEIEEHILTFEEARSSGILEGLLAKRVQQHYESLKSTQSPIVYHAGKLNSFSNVQDAVMLDLFQKLLARLQRQANEVAKGSVAAKIQKIAQADSMVKWRYWSYLQAQRAFIEKQQDQNQLPWSLVHKQPWFYRQQVLRTPLEKIFDLDVGQWLPSVFEGKPLDRLVRCVAHANDTPDPFTIADQLQQIIGQSIDREALQLWFDGLQLDLDMAFLENSKS